MGRNRVNGRAKKRGERKPGLVRVSRRRLSAIRPSPENRRLYRPVDPADPDILELAKSIKERGLQEPLVISADRYIISGHRRFMALKLAGIKTALCRVSKVRRAGDHDRFMKLLRECNLHRVKSADEQVREEVVSASTDQAYVSMLVHREEQAEVWTESIELGEERPRPTISTAKLPFLKAILDIIYGPLQDYWPTSDRQIHYQLLNDPPLRHASKPGSTYRNDRKSYHDLTDLLTRARLEDAIPWECIGDETRPVVTWDVWRDPAAFTRKGIDGFLTGYWRDLLQSQPNHIEVLCEKNTVLPILKPVAAEYCLPITSGRGFCSINPRHDLAVRFRKSGKQQLVLLLITDMDPDGDMISQSFARSMRDDFVITPHAIRVALTEEQVEDLDLPPGGKAKKGSMNYPKYLDAHGTDDVWELEALSPEQLQEFLRDAIDEVIDTDAFNGELDAEKADAESIAANRKKAIAAMGILGEETP